MTIKVDVFSDYVCPYCVLFESVLTEATRDLDVDVRWRPFELRPEPTPTLRPEDDYLANVWKKSVYPLAHKLGVPLSLPSISPQPYTRLAHEGFQFAKKAGKALEYHSRVFHAFFQEDRDIGDPAELTKLAAEIGLDESSFRAALESGEYAELHKESLKKAMEFGVNSVPSVFIDGKVLQGVYDPLVLRPLLVKLAASGRLIANETALLHNALDSSSRAPEITPQITRVSR